MSTLSELGLAARCELPKSEPLRVVDSSLTGLTDSVLPNSEAARTGCALASSPLGRNDNELPNSVEPRNLNNGVLVCVSVTLCFTASILLPYVLLPVLVRAGSVCSLRTVVGNCSSSRLVVVVVVVLVLVVLVMCNNIGNGGGARGTVGCSIGTGNGGTVLLNDVTSSAHTFVQLSLPSLSEHCEHEECEHTESKHTNTEPVCTVHITFIPASKYVYTLTIIVTTI